MRLICGYVSHMLTFPENCIPQRLQCSGCSGEAEPTCRFKVVSRRHSEHRQQRCGERNGKRRQGQHNAVARRRCQGRNQRQGGAVGGFRQERGSESRHESLRCSSAKTRWPGSMTFASRVERDCSSFHGEERRFRRQRPWPTIIEYHVEWGGDGHEVTLVEGECGGAGTWPHVWWCEERQ